MGKIEVYFKNLNYADDKAYYHEFVVWTPDKGLPQFIRGGPKANEGLGSGSGGGSGSAGSAGAKDGVNVPFGSILVINGTYDKKHAQDWAKPGADPSQIILTGSDQKLEPFWQKMVVEGQKINRANIAYAFGGPNSNTVATTLLQAAGLPQPKGNGLNGPTPAPGEDMSLLGQHYSARRGYLELTENAAVRGSGDIEHDLGALLNGFHAALKAAAEKRTAPVPGMGLYRLALAAGRLDLAGSRQPVWCICLRRENAGQCRCWRAARRWLRRAGWVEITRQELVQAKARWCSVCQDRSGKLSMRRSVTPRKHEQGMRPSVRWRICRHGVGLCWRGPSRP